MSKACFWGLVKYALAFGVLGVVLWLSWDPPTGRGLKDVWQAHAVEGRPIQGWYVAAAVGLLLVSIVVTQARWYLLVGAQGFSLSFPAALRLGWVGFVFNTLLPGSVGGDIVKAAALAREQKRGTAAVATVIMDRIIGMWGLLLFVAVVGGLAWAGGWLEGRGGNAAQVIVIVAGAVVGVSIPCLVAVRLLNAETVARVIVAVRRVKYVGKTAAGLLGAALLYRNRGRCLTLALILTWVNQIAVTLMFLACVRALWDGDAIANAIPTTLDHFLIVPLTQLLAAIPLFPGGAGIGEAGYGGLYALFGSSPANGVLGSLVQRALTLVIAGFGLLGYLALRPRTSDPAADVQPGTSAGSLLKPRSGASVS